MKTFAALCLSALLGLACMTVFAGASMELLGVEGRIEQIACSNGVVSVITELSRNIISTLTITSSN